MRRFLVIFLFIIQFIIVNNVYAGSINDVVLNCPKVVSYGEQFTCTLYGNVSDYESINDISLSRYVDGEIRVLDESSEVIKNGNSKLYTIKLKAQYESSTAKLSYKIKYDNIQVSSNLVNIKIANNVNTLKDIKIDNKTIEGFLYGKVKYNISTRNAKVKISATPSANNATVSGLGTKNLGCGNNTFVIKVKAEYGSTENYTLNFNRICEYKPYLKDIKLSEGKLDPTFNKDKTDYVVKVDSSVSSITVEGIKQYTSHTVTGNVVDKKLEYGSNKIKITVKNNDNEAKTYTVNVIRKDERSSGAHLASLSLSTGNIDFDKNIYNYEVSVLFDISSIEVLAVPEDENAKVEIFGNDNLAVGPNKVIVKVTAENEDTVEYEINVIRLADGVTLGNNPNIKSLTVEGYDLNFKSDKTDYKLVIKDETSLNISVIMEDETSTYNIIGNENLQDDSVIKIVTTSADGTEKTYTITVTKANYLPYILFSAGGVVVLISTIIFVYFRFVKKKKENLDVNGYKIDKDYKDPLTERKVFDNVNDNEPSNSKLNNNIDPNNNIFTKLRVEDDNEKK